MRELDVLLSAWLEAHWDSASEDQRRAFRRLLEQEDDLLLSWLLGRSVPPEPDLRMIVEVLREGTDT